MQLMLLFISQVLLQSFYCTFAYTGFKNSSYFPYAAMGMGLISQFIWSQILRASVTHTQATVSGVFFDSITFIIWAAIPLAFFSSSFNKIGLLGVSLVVIGMLMVGFQKGI